MPDKPEEKVTPSRKAAKSGGSIPARIVTMPAETWDWETLNPKMKGFKNAKLPDPEKMLPDREKNEVTRGYVGGESGKGRSQ